MNRIKIAFCLKITEHDGIFFKYEGEEYRQFREALAAYSSALSAIALVSFVTLDDLKEDGTFSKYYTLIGDTRKRLEFKQYQALYNPDLVLNREKQRLLRHPAVARARWKIYNHPDVAKYGDKTISTEEFGYLMPESLLVSDNGLQRREIEGLLKKHEELVFKPVNLNGGRGIRRLNEWEEIADEKTPYILQEFIETSQGFEGVSGRHDVRLYVIDARLVLMSVRQPKDGGFLANTSQGGSIAFFSPTDIPDDLRRIAQPVVDRISHICYNYFISLDFFKGEHGWLLIEINDQPGVPASYQTAEAENIYTLLVKSAEGRLNDNR